MSKSFPEYFALPNPDDPAEMTLWRRPEGYHAAFYPPRARYGPILLKSDVPAEVRSDQKAKALWVADWYHTHANPWLDRMRAAIDADPVTAAGRYAAIQGRCCCCNRELKDADSLRNGVGPDCSDGWPDSAVAALAAAVAQASAAEALA